MKIYSILPSLDTRNTGIYAQVQDIGPGYDVQAPYSYYNIDTRKPIEFEFKPPELILAPRAKVTDYINSIPTSMSKLIPMSDRFWRLIQDFNLPAIQSYETNLHYSGKVVRYHLVYLPEVMDEVFIDFDRSEFAINQYGEFVEKIDIPSYQRLLKAKKEIELSLSILPQSLHLKLNSIDIDLFRLRYACSATFVSERLKIEIEKNNVTGVSFIPLEEVGLMD